MKSKILVLLSVSLILFGAKPSFSQNQHVLKGKIINGSTMQPVSFALVIIEGAGLVGNAPNGIYAVNVQKPGKYTVKVQSQGLQTITTVVTIEGVTLKDFTLNSTASGKTGITIRGERDIQKISRQTMTAKQIKEVPASFGDSISALSSLPGINRTGGFFGPLVIRGADSSFNGYYIDDIPLYKPMHFGGIHSVINSNLMSEIDVYSSAFPAQFGNAQAAVININTIDDVKEFGGYSNIGLISSDALIHTPITSTEIVDGKPVKKQEGYFIASGRYSYLTLFIPFFYEKIINKSLDYLPEYWDYQIKVKYNLNDHNSLTLLSFGNKDYIKLILKENWMDEGDDPAFANAKVYQNDQAHSVGLYYTFKPNDSFTNTLMVYGAFNKSKQWFNLPSTTAAWTKDLGITSTPYISGVKDKIRLEWWKSHGELRAGIEANYYYFKTKGNTILSQTDDIDVNDQNSMKIIPLGETYKNKTLISYIENKINTGWVTFVPGIHSEYLNLNKTTTVDPRGMISISFPTKTTIGAAGGKYSSFVQTNPVYFNTFPNIAGYDYLKPQRSTHRSVSLEQKVSDFTFKTEGFYNNFYDIVIQDTYVVDGKERVARNSMKLRTYGAEFLVKASDESEQGLFGWISYTYNRSRTITHQENNSKYGSIWYYSSYDMPHVIKAVTGYTFGQHTLSSKFQLSSSTPYTEIVGDNGIDTAFAAANAGRVRITPVYGTPNTARFPSNYRLDLRYSYKTNYKWGYITWYIEVIGALTSQDKEYKWDYRYTYIPGVNPVVKDSKGGLSVIPNFGVETKF